MTRFSAVSTLSEQMAGTASRLAKRAAIAEAVAAVHLESGANSKPDELALFVLYLAGLPFAEADPRKLNAGGALLSKAVFAVSGATDAAFTLAYRRHGDLGAAAYDLLADNAAVEPMLSLPEVQETFAGMATAKTTAIRAALVEGLLRRATALDAKYLLKLMLGDMRIGVKQSLVEEAIAVASGTDVAAVRHAVMLEADLGRAAGRAFAGTLSEARMTLFHPLGFMLASPVESPEEAVARFTAKPPKAVPEKKPKRKKKEPEPEMLDEVMAETLASDSENAYLIEAEAPQGVHALLEDKYDGMRAQVHCGDLSQPGRVAIYSRSREDVTESFPELAEAFASVTEPVILDGEILGWDFAAAQALPFAVLGQRIGRKRVSTEVRQQIPVVFMAFDLMFTAGELILPQPLQQRRNLLEALAERISSRVHSPLAAPPPRRPQSQLFTPEREVSPDSLPRLILSPARLVESAEEIDRAYADARARANEGVMLKAASSPYLPGRRGIYWVKLKRELGTLDVVITGAEYGSGRKSQFLSDYTFAVQSENGELLNVGKAYSGVTDVEIAELTEFLKAHTLEDQGHFRTVEPLVILEVAFNNVMRSDRHASGFALRFPRILRIRSDKPLAEIDTVARVEEIYQSQVDKPAADDFAVGGS